MTDPAAKTMFVLYREAQAPGRYRVVYFTELEDRARDAEIERAMSGEHLYGGFLWDAHKAQAKRTLENLVTRLNAGEAVTPADVERALDGLEAAS